MASTYSTNLRLELIGTGEQQGTWGATTNVNLGTLLEEAIGGYTSVTVSDAGDTTLTTNNGSADQSRNMVLNLTGTISAARNVICPAIEKLYVVKNATTGGYAVTIKVSGQTGVSIPNGSTVFVYVDGTDVRAVTASMATQSANNVAITGGSISGITDLAVADGGTGASTASNARANLGAAASGANTDLTSVYLNNTGLKLRDTDASHGLTVVPGSNLSADRTFTLTTGDASRTFDISAGNVTISTAGAALIDDATASDQRTTLGLGTIATQNANNVTITGGSISGITDIAVADGGTGASDAGTARTNLGLGTISTQDSNNVSITGGAISGVTISGITDLAVADGGTGASSFTAYSVIAAGTTGAGALQSVGLGTTGQILTSNGAGALPTWQTLTIPVAFPSGTKLLFQQTNAPTGWTKDTTHNNKALRVVNGAVGSGGTVAFTTAFASQAVAGTVGNQTATGTVSGTVGDTALTLAQIPAHSHTVPVRSGSGGNSAIPFSTGLSTASTVATSSEGSSAVHTHTFSGSFTGVAHSHTFTGTAIDLAVQYVDIIIATKD